MSSYDDDLTEGPDDADADLLGDSDGWDGYDEVECPSCGRLISEVAPKCPHCGDWVIERTTAERRSGTWVWPILIVLLILGFFMLFII